MSFVTGLVIIVLIFAVATIILSLVSKKSSKNGRIVVETDEETGKVLYTLELDFDPYELKHMRTVSFEIVSRKEIAD